MKGIQAVNLPPCANEKVPEAEGPFYHSVELQTRFGDYDMLGHMNNSVYLQLLDLAKVSYFEAATGGPLRMTGEVVVVVNVNISFYSPALPGEPLVALTRCMRLSLHSFTLEQRIVNPSTGDVKCIASTVMAGFDTATGQGCEITPFWADALRRMES